MYQDIDFLRIFSWKRKTIIFLDYINQ